MFCLNVKSLGFMRNLGLQIFRNGSSDYFN